MKKLLNILVVLIVSAVALASCEVVDEDGAKDYTSAVQDSLIYVSPTETGENYYVQRGFIHFLDITHNEETHEYMILFINGEKRSMCHWEGCKYCKEMRDGTEPAVPNYSLKDYDKVFGTESFSLW